MGFSGCDFDFFSGYLKIFKLWSFVGKYPLGLGKTQTWYQAEIYQTLPYWNWSENLGFIVFE